ncbi:hypothetical protein G4B88_012622 [Cannabis sativa]|uniref:Large ribosomal subunit protein eL20 domain-containing protein n=1 Tax=Cannabis sativa TaxID=3483 RepID=A0A7J6EFL9_CANSA|nr:hypothetical protein G4B88_012622 [Cannabis sativa]
MLQIMSKRSWLCPPLRAKALADDEIQLKSPNWLFGQRKYEENVSSPKVISGETNGESTDEKEVDCFRNQYWVSSGDNGNDEDIIHRYLAMSSVDEANGWYGGTLVGDQDESSEIYKHYAQLCEIFEKNLTTIKNFGILLRYQSRTNYHNMYKEYRDTTLNGAVEQMYTEMASRHRVRFPCIQIIKTATIPAKLCKREITKQFHNSKIKFPLVFKKVRPPTRKLKTTYKATRPNLFL